jgi:hypothetical protein
VDVVVVVTRSMLLIVRYTGLWDPRHGNNPTRIWHSRLIYFLRQETTARCERRSSPPLRDVFHHVCLNPSVCLPFPSFSDSLSFFLILTPAMFHHSSILSTIAWAERPSFAVDRSDRITKSKFQILPLRYCCRNPREQLIAQHRICHDLISFKGRCFPFSTWFSSRYPGAILDFKHKPCTRPCSERCPMLY